MTGRCFKQTKSLFTRIFVGITAPAVIAAGACYLYFHGNPAPCLMHLVTGLFCPGCGSGRAARALLHFDFVAALDFNPLFVLIVPFAAYYLLKRYVNFVFGKDLLPFFRFSAKTGWIILAVIVCYTVARNLPFAPFVYLAP